MQVVFRFIHSHEKLLIRLLALGFFVAPIVNICLSFLGSGVSQWYQLSTVSSFLKSVPALDYVCLVGLLMTGVLLFMNKSFSLYGAGVILGLISIFAVIRVFDNSANSITDFYLKAYVVGGSLLNILILVLLFFLAKKKVLS